VLIQRLASFCDHTRGGNPAGVVITREPLPETQMQAIAREVGYSETAFAVPTQSAIWRVRYFSPTSEVPFCGHATLALGAALAMQEGDRVFRLQINQASISVEGRGEGSQYSATLTSPPTLTWAMAASVSEELLGLFGLSNGDLDSRIPIVVAHAGANHAVLMLKSRQRLAAMKYVMQAGQALMRREGWLTVLLAFAEAPQLFHTRNAFASGGVYEDPASGAATAALAGYLRELGWPHAGRIEVHQGDDMGQPSRLYAEISDIAGAPIRVSGTVRIILPRVNACEARKK
jgi:PhzF family phenazine biosynthesis protein